MNTRRTFNLAGAAGLGRMIVVNKCDLENIDFDRLLDSIRETFGNACVPVNLPDRTRTEIQRRGEHAGSSVARPGRHRRRPGRMEPGRDGRDRRSRRIADGAVSQRRNALGRGGCGGTFQVGRRRNADSDFLRQLQDGRRRARADGRAGPLRALAARVAAKGEERRRRRGADRSGTGRAARSPRSSRRGSTRSSPR